MSTPRYSITLGVRPILSEAILLSTDGRAPSQSRVFLKNQIPERPNATPALNRWTCIPRLPPDGPSGATT